MNYYVVVEGRSAKQVYEKWIPIANPKLRLVRYPRELDANNFVVIDGGGNPYYYKVIENAIEDVNVLQNADRLVIAVDSENLTYQQKYQEVCGHIQPYWCLADYRIVIQHFCLETWALGNRIYSNPKRKPKNLELKAYLKLFNAGLEDPELMPSLAKEQTRAQFAARYLALLIENTQPSKRYSKRNPNVLTEPGYFAQVHSRLKETRHIMSFQHFVDAFTD